MSVDHLQFLKNKFINDFGEAMEEFNNELPLRLHFQEILDALQPTVIHSLTPIIMKDWLYDLKYLLEECVMLAEKEREYFKAADQKNKKTYFMNARYLKKLWFLHKKGKRLDHIQKKLQEVRDVPTLIEGSSSSNWFSIHKPWQLCHFDASEIHGFDEHFQKVEKLLLETPNDHVVDGVRRTVGIVGMGGVGKTTLARMVFESSRVCKMFDSRIWVRLSENFYSQGTDPREEILGRSLDKNQTSTEFRYLIVLDNILHWSEWYSDLVLELHKRSPMSIIIITCRFDQELASRMVGEQNLYQLQPNLDDEACWKIFIGSTKRKLFIRSDDDTIMLRMKEEIVDRCDGLPFAAKTLAEIISTTLAQHSENKYWSDSRIKKRIVLRLDVHESDTYWWARTKIRAIVGASVSRPSPENRFLEFTTRRHLVELLREVGKICPVELLSVLQCS